MKTKNHWPALGCTRWVAGFLLLAVWPSSADAECPHWDVSDIWTAKQSNHHDVEFVLDQYGTQLKGTARETADIAKIVIEGTMIGNQFSVTVFWSGGAQGVYRGIVDANGRLAGTTYDKNNPSSRATWVASRPMKCREEASVPPSSVPQPAPPAPSSKPKVIKSTGRSPVTTPPPVTASAPATISANPPVVLVSPGQDKGTTTLTWDGGSNHPNIKLTVKSESHNAFAVRQPQKGSREVTVDRGTTTFALTDANSGEWLASATVQAKESSGTDWDQSRNPRRRRQPSNGEN